MTADIRERLLAVQEKAGFIPNVFLVLAHRPDEFRTFFAYHDALMGQTRQPDDGREAGILDEKYVIKSKIRDCIQC